MPFVVQNKLNGETLPAGKVVRFQSDTRQFEGSLVSVDGPWAVVSVLFEWDPEWRTQTKIKPEDYDVPVTVLFARD